MFTAEVLETEICRITDGVFTTMLGIPVEHYPAEEPASLGALKMTGVVTVTGAWSGAITVTCSAEFAKTIACVMFGTDPNATAEADVRDAMGEMANMIGGNLKSLIPPPAALSLPSVIAGEQYSVNLPACSEVGRYAFLAHGEYVSVSVLEHS
jgi:chemotaxis protein CheX